MGNAIASRRSVFKGQLIIGEISFPIAAQLKQEIFSLPGHLFHEGCGERITQERICPKHPDIDYLETYSAIQVSENEWKRVDSEVRDILLDRKSPYVKVVSTHKVSEIPALFAEEKLVVNRIFELVPQRIPNQGFDPKTTIFIQTFLDRLRIKKKFALLEIPFDGMLRKAILMSNGTIYSLLYDEEIREKVNVMAPEIVADKTVIGIFDKAIASLDSPFPHKNSCSTVMEKVERFLASSGAPTHRGKVGVVVTLNDLMATGNKKIS